MVARKTISLPDDLAAQVDQASQEHDVNWSQVAQLAFREKLVELASRKKEKTMMDTINRLKASKERAESDSFKRGEEAGRQWAMGCAEWPHLERAAEQDENAWDESVIWDHPGRGFHLAATILGADEDFTKEDAEYFWNQALGEGHDPEDDELLHGFFVGASEVYDEMKDKV